MTEEKTYSQMRKEFQEAFFKKISPGLSKYESERLRQFGYTRAVKIAALIIILVLVFLTKQIDIGLILFICCIAGAVCFGLKKKFENEIKQKIMPYVCKCLGDLKWKYAQCSFEQLLCKSGIIDRYNRVSYDDSFTGIYKDINYEICETSFYYKTGTGKNSSTRTVFKGVMIKLDMNKSFTGNTVIRPDTLKHASPAANLKHTTLEDVVFEKKFDVFTDDEVETDVFLLLLEPFVEIDVLGFSLTLPICFWLYSFSRVFITKRTPPGEVQIVSCMVSNNGITTPLFILNFEKLSRFQVEI